MKNDQPNIMRPFGLPDSASTPVVTPLSASVVYASRNPDMLDAHYTGELPGYTYAREGHPNADALAERIDALEDVSGGIITSSGMAAVTAGIMGVLQSGDHIIAGDQLYGRSLRLMQNDLKRFGIEVTFCNATDAENIQNALRINTKMVLVEVVSNPTLRVADLSGLSSLLKPKNIILAIDNTFTTPLSLKAADHGADIIIHSVTKLLAGHSDVTLGYVWATNKEVNKSIYDFAVTTGMTPSPFDCWLAERGLLTFPLRFEKAQENARQLANFLAEQENVKRVLYPLRPDHPDIALAKNLLGVQGCNMVSFELTQKTRESANRFVQNARGIAFAPTLGDVGTTLSHPASSSHRALSPSQREDLGISEGFFRVSVGVEDISELLITFDNALKTL